MKRLFFILIFFALLLTGCNEREYGILDYQGKNLEAECVVNEKFKLTLIRDNDICTLSVKEPAEIEGVVFELSQNELYACVGETRIKADKDALKGICAILNTFSLDEAGLTSAKEQGKESLMCFESDYGTYQLTIGENAMPKTIRIYSEAYTYDITVSSIKILN